MPRPALLLLITCACSSFDTVTAPDASVEDVVFQNDVTILPLDATIPGDGSVDADLLDGDGSCATWPDGTPCKAAPDACHVDGVCQKGVCMAPATHVDGYNWKPGDATAICCAGTPIQADTDTNCGVCGIHCNASNGESCQALGGRYFCRGCIANSGCWSHCCSLSFNPPSCAASDCNGNCSSAYCPDGTHCAVGFPSSSDYCSY